MVVPLEHQIDVVIHEDGLEVETKIEVARVRARLRVHGLMEIHDVPSLRGRGQVRFDPVVHVGVEVVVSVERDEMNVRVIEGVVLLRSVLAVRGEVEGVEERLPASRNDVVVPHDRVENRVVDDRGVRGEVSRGEVGHLSCFIDHIPQDEPEVGIQRVDPGGDGVLIRVRHATVAERDEAERSHARRGRTEPEMGGEEYVVDDDAVVVLGRRLKPVERHRMLRPGGRIGRRGPGSWMGGVEDLA